MARRCCGMRQVFDDRASGTRADRPSLRQALDCAREGDVLLVVSKLDGLGRSLAHPIAPARRQARCVAASHCDADKAARPLGHVSPRVWR